MPDHPILYQNASATVTLVDIPTSIAHAQGFQGSILSTQARSKPFTSTEPKSQRARDKVLSKTSQCQHDLEYSNLAKAALKDISTNHAGAWSSPRWYLIPGSKSDSEISAAEKAISGIFQETVKINRKVSTPRLSSLGSQYSGVLDSGDGTYYNDSGDETRMVTLDLQDNHGEWMAGSSQEPQLRFRVPPRSSFLLADCNASYKFRNLVRWLSQEYELLRVFNLILLDPPWENRSAKRRAAYETNPIRSLIGGMDLSSYLAPNGLVAIWVTNKPAHRELVLGTGGIFDSLNVSLIEEWIWIKTTTEGEPVTQLDGLWRKPYEVLLLAQAPESRLQMAKQTDNVIRRVLAGAPDLHSRKPCLKTLIEPFLPTDYQALEIFARYLVQGWTSWGNEVLKFNYDGCYTT